MSNVAEMRADRIENGTVEYDSWKMPDLHKVEEVIGRMDQWTRTESSLRTDDWWFILIGGGSDSYVVTIENQMSGVRFQLVNPQRSESEQLEIVTGGQRGLFPANLVVGLDEAIQAAKHFAETKQPDPSLNWVEEETP